MPKQASTKTASTVSLPPSRRIGISREDYLELFLEAGDLGPQMKRIQDSRLKGPDPADIWFAKYQGILTGMAIWLGPTGDPIWRLVDIRTVFPHERFASGWHADAILYNSERRPEVTGAPLVGEECRVFGGSSPSPLDPSTTLTAFFYVFRRERVVVKLFVMQGTDSPAPLTPESVADIARRIDGRIRNRAAPPGIA